MEKIDRIMQNLHSEDNSFLNPDEYHLIVRPLRKSQMMLQGLQKQQ